MLAWGPRGPPWELTVPPTPLSLSAHPRLHPYPHCTYPGGQALLAVQANSTLIGDLREVFILKLLEADVMGEPGRSGDDVVTHREGRRVQGGAACRQGPAPPTPRRGFLGLDWGGRVGMGVLLEGMGLSPPNIWAWHGLQLRETGGVCLKPAPA